MPEIRSVRETRLLRAGATLLIALCMMVWGCQAKEPPLSPAAASFKKAVQEEIARLAPALLEPVAKKSTAQINITLQKIFSDPKNEGPLWPYKIVVTDKNGVSLGKYPVERGFSMDFSNYSVVQKCLKNCKTSYGRLFTAKGSNLYVICSPILKGEEVKGILALALDAQEVSTKWGISEQQFLALEINE